MTIMPLSLLRGCDSPFRAGGSLSRVNSARAVAQALTDSQLHQRRLTTDLSRPPLLQFDRDPALDEGDGGAAAASSALVGVRSLLSSEQELPSAAADVIDVGRWKHGVERAGFKELTSEEWRLLAVKLPSSQHVKVLNLSGNQLSTEKMLELAQHLGLLTALQDIDLRGTHVGNEGAERLAKPLGKLTALRKLNLSGTVSFVFL
jgi:hypothetical protein